MSQLLNRRSFLRGTGVAISLPFLDAMRPAFGDDSTEKAIPRRMVAIETNMGILPQFFFPEKAGGDYPLSPYLKRLASHRDNMTVFSGVSLPGVTGASGTAILLALATLLAENPPPVGVDLLFVDGEDYGPDVEDMLLGARRYAETLEDDDRPVYGLLLDMVGDADPSFPVEGYSAQAANVIVQKVWRAAERLGYREFFPTAVGRNLMDDHVPLIEAGVRTANLIDFTYGPNNEYWHTADDRLEHVSAATLGMVGEVVTELIYSGG